MKDFFSFIKSTIVYLFGNVLIKMISFFMLPLYTKVINPADYGTYDLYIAYITFLSSVLFLDIWGGIMRFMFDYKDENGKSRAIVSGGLIFLISSAIYTIIIVYINLVNPIEHIVYIYFYGIMMNLQNLFGFIARGFKKNKLYVAAGVIGTSTTVLSNIILLVGLNMNYEALYISSCLGFAFNIITILFGIRDCKIFKIKNFRLDLFKKMITYSLPLSINSVAYWFLTSYNKVVINNKLTSYDNGIYAIAGKFGLLINLFTSCFQMAWQELTFSKVDLNSQEKDEFYTTAVNEYIKFLALGLLMLLPFISIAFPFMIDKSYSEAIKIIPFYLMATLLSSVSSFLASIFSTIKKTNIIFKTTIIGSIVNVVFINLLITKFKVQAAVISLLIGYAANIVLRVKLLKENIRIKINYRFLRLYLIPLILVCLVYFSSSIVLNIFLELLIIIGVIYIYREKIKGFINLAKSSI